jgi:RNA ligase (TIGR02306 family)
MAMSYFAVEKKKIAEINPIEGADRIEAGKLEGCEYQFVIGKGEFKVGDEVIYFPIDSLLPKELADYLNVSSFLAGADKNRVKTRKLKGCYSQGLVVPVSKINQFLQIKGINVDDTTTDYTNILQVIKYEVPEIMVQSGRLVGLPEFVGVYDIEGCDNFPDVVNYLMDKKVMITEKVEGSNWGVSISAEGEVGVNQHNFAIKEIEDKKHTFWEVARTQGLIELVKTIKEKHYPTSSVIIRGEMLGGSIQKNIYNFKSHKVLIYDIKVDYKYLDADVFVNLMHMYEQKDYLVPILAKDITLREWLNGKTVQEASNGQSLILPSILREGIVIKPMVEEYVVIGITGKRDPRCLLPVSQRYITNLNIPRFHGCFLPDRSLQ